MSLSLQETLQRIDRYVTLSDGSASQTVSQWLERIDLDDASEYVITADDKGRLLIHQLDFAGYPIRPPAFVEDKKPATKPRSPTLVLNFFPKLTSQYPA